MDQVCREYPPGYGGVERVAHLLAEECGGAVFYLKPSQTADTCSLSVSYRRRHLASFAIGRLLFPLPSAGLMALLVGKGPLLVHLPCPTLLALAVLAHWLRPQRSVRVYWHAFLEPQAGFTGCLEAIYQFLALRLIRTLPVITTSPQLRQALIEEDLPAAAVTCLPCSLPQPIEQGCTSVWHARQGILDQKTPSRGVLIAIGRLDSYKRIDWLLEAMASAPAVLALHVVGDGPHRDRWEALAAQSLLSHQQVFFHGRVDEGRKLELLRQSDVLVLASDRSNEAFGIVQLEAMAAGIPSLSLSRLRSGMHWVSSFQALPWNGNREQLGPLLQRLLSDPSAYRLACRAARVRYDHVFSLQVWRQNLQLIFPGDG